MLLPFEKGRYSVLGGQSLFPCGVVGIIHSKKSEKREEKLCKECEEKRGRDRRVLRGVIKGEKRGENWAAAPIDDGKEQNSKCWTRRTYKLNKFRLRLKKVFKLLWSV
jgi:hypothetical protein